MAVFTAIGTAVGLAGATATVAGAGIAAGVAGAGIQAYGAIQSARAQQQASAVQQRQARVQATRQRRQGIRQAILARGQALNVAAGTGQLGGSAVSGGLASVSSQLGSNLGYGTQMEGLSRDYFGLTQRAARMGSLAQIGGSISNIGFAVAGSASNPDSLFGRYLANREDSE
jgi:hypothetical protein